MITQLFQPEPNHLKGLAFAKELVRQGHEVEVLTGFPNYPGGQIYPGYRQRIWQRETTDGISIIRVPLYPDHSSSGLRRILCYISLAFSASIPGLFLVRKPDVVHVYQGPATLALPAIILRLLRKVPYVLDVQDLWPESVTSSGMLKSRFLTSALTKWCDFANRLAAKIVVLSPGYKETLINRGVSATKVDIVYNWCDESQVHKTDGVTVSVDHLGFEGRFSVVYAGNLGRVQALDSVLEAAELLSNDYPDVIFVFVGDGVDALRLKELANAKKLKNVLFVPRQPVSEIGSILRRAAALLIHLQDDPLCRVGIPQKTQAYLAMGRPLIAAVRGNAASLVEESKAGVTCEPTNPESIAAAVIRLRNMPENERAGMGNNGLKYYEEYLSFSVGVQKMNELLSEAAS